MAAEINKAVVPEDYARLIYSQTDREKLSIQNASMINTIKTHDLTSTSSNEIDRIDVSNLPTYDIVGEIECIYAKGTLTSIIPLPGRNYKITSRFKIDPEVLSKYRLIRLIVQPNFYFFISSNILNLSYTVSLSINDLEYTYTPSIIIASNFLRLTEGKCRRNKPREAENRSPA
jgi:hypothetical protein